MPCSMVAAMVNDLAAHRRVLKKCQKVLERALELALKEHFDSADKQTLPPLIAEIRDLLGGVE